MASLKWTEDLHSLFVELCATEVIKGNRIGTNLSKEAWITVHKELSAQKEVVCTHKQLKNHWEKMKDEYQTFKKLKFVESGLGWNETTKMIEATEIWWLQKIQENPKFKKFKNRNLSLFMTYYDTLFGDVVATGDRARTANMYSAVNLETGEQFTEEAADNGKEGSGDSEENNAQSPPSLFPSTSLKTGRSSGSKRKRSGAEMICDSFNDLVAAMSSKSTQSTAAQTRATNEDAALTQAYTILNSIEEITQNKALYFYAGQVYLQNKCNRTFFILAKDNAIRMEMLVHAFKAAGY